MKRALIILAALVGLCAPSLALAQSTGAGTITPRAPSGTTTIATGGTAVTVVTGPINGGYITNPPNASSQGIGTAENAYCDMVGTPGSTDAAANGTTSPLQPGQPYYLPALRPGVTVLCNAATSGHKLGVTVW